MVRPVWIHQIFFFKNISFKPNVCLLAKSNSARVQCCTFPRSKSSLASFLFLDRVSDTHVDFAGFIYFYLRGHSPGAGWTGITKGETR